MIFVAQVLETLIYKVLDFIILKSPVVHFKFRQNLNQNLAIQLSVLVWVGHPETISGHLVQTVLEAIPVYNNTAQSN